ncbi:endoplasmic reticulum aminopeptidase 1 [Octopus sinensis]|uniref:Aminopeptidase n=1 Tax=Octopus sinensis TaxID=2607531 RepID=A0A6P7SV30_9MOLL|nr:endoplasmic reticulum aminopeptidase 1 [Octopus sinensis]
MALTVGVLLGIVILAVAFIASFARPDSQKCSIAPVQAPRNDLLSNSSDSEKTEDSSTEETDTNFPWSSVWLPKSVSPLHYSIFIHPNLTTSLVTGNVSITCRAVSSTNFIILHNTQNITELVIHSHNNSKLRSTDLIQQKNGSMLYIKLDRFLKEEEIFDIIIYFRSRLQTGMVGFYLSSYTAEDGSTRYLATTHFEPASARLAFPCFDEPDKKANFTLFMVREQRHKTLFNMPLKATTSYIHGLFLDSFGTTPKMSTYLVSFVVSDFASVSGISRSGIKVHIFTPPQNINMTDLALESSIKILDFYEEYFEIPYPLPKIDLIAIPDFEQGAMENWGLITFRTTQLLFDSSQTVRLRMLVIETIAHEFAHQWFGNLVTLKWWDDLWLNEGFATFMQWIGVKAVEPDFDTNQYIMLRQFISALNKDAFETSHPIENGVKQPRDIAVVFDSITYKKGASILNMLQEFLGKERFRKRVCNYLKKFPYLNAETKDLWEMLSSDLPDKNNTQPTEPDFPVATVMDTWTKQKGHPLVTLKLKGTTVTATQEIFLHSANISHLKPSPYNYKWYIPLTYVTSMKPNSSETVWLNMTSTTFQVEKGTKWVKGNYKSVGFYRVNYEVDVWMSLVSELTTNYQIFQPEDRTILLHDLSCMARVGKVNYSLYLDASEYLVQENEYVPFVTGISDLLKLDKYLVYTPYYEFYRNYILKLIINQIKILGWENEGSAFTKMLRSSVLSCAIILKHTETLDKGKAIFDMWRYSNKSINPEIFSIVLRSAIKTGSSEIWKYLWDVYSESTNPLLKTKILSALGHTPNSEDLSRLLVYAMDKDKIRTQDLFIVFASVSDSVAGRLLAWRFIELHWDELTERYKTSEVELHTLLSIVISEIITQEEYDQVTDFLVKKHVPINGQTISNVLEFIRLHIFWMKTHFEPVSEWFQKHK